MKWKNFFLFLPIVASALEVEPWFSEVYEFHFDGTFAYSRFNSVQGARPAISSPYNVFLIYSGLEFSSSPQWCVDGDVQLADTSRTDFHFRSCAIQFRYLWLDDIVGDPVSFATGGSLRVTSDRALHDISCPSHSNIDFEIHFSMGKEFDFSDCWEWRFWCFGALGQANVGSPWVRGIAAIAANIDDRHRWDLLALGSNGYGRHPHLNPDDFHGYAKIRQKSIDIGIRYGYRLGIWGTLRFEYDRRVLAKACPQNVNNFVVSYLLPFCF